MKKKIILKSFLLSAVAMLGLATSAFAGGDGSAAMTPAPAPETGLLGQSYASLTYSYLNLANSPVNADNYNFSFNQPLNAGFDAVFGYDWTQNGLDAGSRLNTQSLTGMLRAFSPSAYVWGKPYVEAGVGYAWQRGTPAGRDNSILWEAAVGVELRLAPAFTLTPFVQYADTPDLAGNGTWKYGVKANYWVDHSWALTAGLARDDHQNNLFTIGTNFRF